MHILLLRKALSYLSGIIDVERCNGIKKYICNPRRDSLKNDKLDILLRIFYNSPDIEHETLNEWIIEVAKIWNRKNRIIIVLS